MTTLTMSLNQFRMLVAPVVPFVAEHSAVAALEGVRVRTAAGTVIAEGASARMAGMCIRPLPGAVTGFDVVFPMSTLQYIVGSGDTNSIYEFELSSYGAVIVSQTGDDGRTSLVEFDAYDPGRFPDLHKKLVKALEIPQRAMSAWLDADQMHAFAVAAERANNPHRAPLVIHPGPNRHDQVLVTCGDHFAGLAASASNTPQQPSFTRLRVKTPPPGDPIELWTKQLTTPEGE